MAKPQQAELRRSGKVPALDPDASVAKLSAQDTPGTSGSEGAIPEDQRPGHHPEHEQDKPDMDKFAERLGIVSEEEEPPEAPHVVEGSKVTRLQPKTEAKAKAKADKPSFSPIGLALVGPVTGFLIAKKVLEGIKRLRR
jgi:hypothetical protein